jgi:hypothetical protein
MNKVFTAIILLFAMHSSAQSLNKNFQDPIKKRLVMINHVTRDSLINFPEFKTVYDNQYPDYSPDSVTVGKLKPLMQGLKLTIVLGTWCGDSKLQVPHFYKVLDQIGFPENDITLICVDGHKKDENGLADGLHIERVPTFIISREGKELGRIVESPKLTLESDLLGILTGK